jgi:hypothetical protein
MLGVPQVRAIMPTFLSVLCRAPLRVNPHLLKSCGMRARRISGGRLHLVGGGFVTGTVTGIECMKAECAPAENYGESIEVEQKFEIDDDLVERVAQSLVFVGSKRLEDSYFDTPTFSLTTSDYWLRLRDNSWELKQVGSRHRRRFCT